MRLGDIAGLDDESVHVKSPAERTATLKRYGATPAEIDFLVRRGRRVELNAFPSADFIKWVEKRLKEAGVRKIVPDGSTLAAAYRWMMTQQLVQRRIDEMLARDGSRPEVERESFLLHGHGQRHTLRRASAETTPATAAQFITMKVKATRAARSTSEGRRGVR